MRFVIISVLCTIIQDPRPLFNLSGVSHKTTLCTEMLHVKGVCGQTKQGNKIAWKTYFILADWSKANRKNTKMVQGRKYLDQSHICTWLYSLNEQEQIHSNKDLWGSEWSNNQVEFIWAIEFIILTDYRKSCHSLNRYKLKFDNF